MKPLTFFSVGLAFVMLASCKQDCPPVTPSTPQVIRDTVFQQNESGFWLRTADDQPLYWQCANQLNFDVTDDVLDLSYTASSAKVIPSTSDYRNVTIIPIGKQTVVGISELKTGNEVRKVNRRYTVVKPPKPRLVLMVNGKEYNGLAPFSKKSRLTVKVVPDADFKNQFPQEAKYEISKINLLAARSLGAPTRVGSYSGAGKDATVGVVVALGSKLNSDVPGTKIYIDIEKVYRINGEGKKVEEKYLDQELAIGAIIK
ncbi:MAG: hypothetical protein AAF598_20660 [Bacteroidota bacterium]